MKFLIDECLRPLVAAGLRDVGHDAIHVGDVGLLGATDEKIMALAVEQARIVVSADSSESPVHSVAPSATAKAAPNASAKAIG